MISKIIVITFAVCYYVITICKCKGLKLNVKAQAWGGITCAITLVLSMIYIPLPTGATISAGSMLPIMLLAVCFNYKTAIVTGWITGILAMILIPVWQPVHWAQIFVEHLICFSCLGYAGAFGTDKKQKVLMGSIVAVVIKTSAHIVAGVVFFSQNSWDGYGAWAYSLAYNLSNSIPEGIITVVILMLLPIKRIKKNMRATV